MVDIHTHSLLSDGAYLPFELAQRAKNKGICILAITDHVDLSNVNIIVKEIVSYCDRFNELEDKIKLIAGVELTYLPLDLFGEVTNFVRANGISLVLAHGETIGECVPEGTNRAAIEARVDVLAHCGLITLEDAIVAREYGVYLELSARKKHSLCNGHIVNIAKKTQVKLVFGSDAHDSDDLCSPQMIKKILLGAGVEQPNEVIAQTLDLAKKKLKNYYKLSV